MKSKNVRLSDDDIDTLEVCKAMLEEEFGTHATDSAVIRLALADYRVLLGLRTVRRRSQ